MSKLKLILPLLLIAVFMVSTYSVVQVVADGGSNSSTDSPDHNGVSSQQENADHTNVQVTFNSTLNHVQLESENHYNGSSTSISVELEAHKGDDLSIHFSYSGEVNHTEKELEIGLQARKVVEFINNNTAVNGYDLNDTLLHTYDLSAVNWTLTMANATVGNNTVWSINETAPLGTGTIQFQFLFTNGYAAIGNNNILGPNALKWTMVISNYTYNTTNSQLGLQMLMSSGQHNSGFSSDHIGNQTEDHQDGMTTGNVSAVNFGNATTSGFFSWIDNYNVDGVNHTIVTSPSVSVDKEDASQNQLYFSFLQGHVINWDPKVGVDRSTTSAYDIAHPMVPLTSAPTFSSLSSTSNKSSPGFEILASVLSIGVIAVVSKRKFKN